MTVEHMRSVAPQINLDVHKMLNEPKSAHAVAYMDKEFAYADGSHNVENTILMGWLLCKHWDDETQTIELWHIINPELLPTVTKRDILTIITRLAYIAVNLNLKLVKNCPESEDKRTALEYHKRIAKNRKAFL